MACRYALKALAFAKEGGGDPASRGTILLMRDPPRRHVGRLLGSVSRAVFISSVFRAVCLTKRLIALPSRQVQDVLNCSPGMVRIGAEAAERVRTGSWNEIGDARTLVSVECRAEADVEVAVRKGGAKSTLHFYGPIAGGRKVPDVVVPIVHFGHRRMAGGRMTDIGRKQPKAICHERVESFAAFARLVCFSTAWGAPPLPRMRPSRSQAAMSC